MRASDKPSPYSIGILGLTVAFSLAASSQDVAKDVWLAIPPPTSQDTYCNDGTFGLFDDLFLGETFIGEAYEGDGGPVIMLSYVEQLAQVKIWTKNTHISDSGDYDVSSPRGEFAYYNPVFVSWAFSTFLPGRHDASFRRKTQSRYDGCISPFARMAWATLQIIKSNPGCRDQLIQQYETDSNPRKSAPTAYTWNEKCTSGVSSRTDFRSSEESEDWVVHPDDITSGMGGAAMIFPGFWMRREIDGSRAAFETGLKRMLQVYDAQWLASYGDKAAHRSVPEEEEGEGTRSDEWQSVQSQVVDQARQRLRAPMRDEAKRVRAARVEAALTTCAKFQAEVSRRRSEIQGFARAGRDATAEGALVDFQTWIGQQQVSSDGVGSALETLRAAMYEIDSQVGSNGVTMETKARFAQQVERACGP